jgi:hypothetical protein
MSYYVPPATQVSHEPSSVSKSENISDEDEDFLPSSITTDSMSNTVVEKKQEKVDNQKTEQKLTQVKFYLNRLLTIKTTNRLFKSSVC